MAWPNKVEFSTLRKALRLTVRIAADRTVHVRGTIRLENDSGHRVLVAERGGAEATCADTNGDGVAGLISLKMRFRDAKSKRQFDVVLLATEADVGVSDVHKLSLQIGREAPVTGTGFVRVSQDPIPQRS